MQVGNEGDAEAFEGFGDITVGEVIFHDTVYAAISGRDGQTKEDEKNKLPVHNIRIIPVRIL